MWEPDCLICTLPLIKLITIIIQYTFHLHNAQASSLPATQLKARIHAILGNATTP